jgi:hypothetical protein
LFGSTTTTSFVFAVTAASIASRSWTPSRSGTFTGVPSKSSVSLANSEKVGSASTTSSPGAISAVNSVRATSFEPCPAMTWSGVKPYGLARRSRSSAWSSSTYICRSRSACSAASARGEVPSGFSFDDNLTKLESP